MNKIMSKLNEIHITTDGSQIKIIEFFNFKNCTIQFLNDGTIVKNIQYGHIKDGNVRNKNKKSYQNIGYQGYGKWNRNNQYEAYLAWTNMIQRCYSEAYQLKQKTYIGCTVSEEWHNFQNFVEWFISNESGYEKGYHLDKDLLFTNNKIYSKETCVFLPREINNLLTKIHTKGVSKNTRKDNYLVYISKFGKSKFFGSYDTEEEGLIVAKQQKLIYIKEIAELWKSKIHKKAYQKLIEFKL